MNSEKINKLLKYEEMDFIAIAISNWHAIGIDVFVHDFYKSEKRRPKGIILIMPHHLSGYVIDENDFICQKFADVYIVKETVENFWGLAKELAINFFYYFMLSKQKRGKKPFYLISPMIPSLDLILYFLRNKYFKLHNPLIILVDEGIGTYTSKKAWSKKLDDQKSKYHGLGRLRLYFTSVYYIELNILSKDIKILKRFLFNKLDKLEVNEDLAGSYKEIFKLRKKSLNEFSKNAVILITTNYLAGISKIDEINFIDDLIGFLIKRNQKIFLKPHPREDISKYSKILEKYSIELLPNNIPIEDLFIDLRPEFVIGFNSTSLLNATVLYNIPSISVYGILDPTISKAEFKRLTDHITTFVEDFEELDQVIRSIKTI